MEWTLVAREVDFPAPGWAELAEILISLCPFQRNGLQEFETKVWGPSFVPFCGWFEAGFGEGGNPVEKTSSLWFRLCFDFHKAR